MSKAHWIIAPVYNQCYPPPHREWEREQESIRFQNIDCRHMYTRVQDDDYLEIIKEQAIII